MLLVKRKLNNMRETAVFRRWCRTATHERTSRNEGNPQCQFLPGGTFQCAVSGGGTQAEESSVTKVRRRICKTGPPVRRGPSRERLLELGQEACALKPSQCSCRIGSPPRSSQPEGENARSLTAALSRGLRSVCRRSH